VKIRAGFVSNSSSSSFVMVGIKIGTKLTDELRKDIMNKVGINWKMELERRLEAEKNEEEEWRMDEDELLREIFYDQIGSSGLHLLAEGTGAPENSVIIGKMLAETRDNGFFHNTQSLSAYQIMKIGKELNKKMSTLNIEPKVYIGTYMC
jgi:hypothetical protein